MTAAPSVDSEDAQRVRDAVADLTSDAAAFASTLVRERSVQGNETDAQRHVIERVRDLGLDVRLLEATDVPGIEDHPEFAETDDTYEGRPNVIATKPGAGDGRSLLFNGHVDVVPEGDAEQWSFDPFGGEIVDGELRGRGASDMKGGVAAMLFAVEALDRAGVELAGDLAIQSVIEEEAGGYGGSLATALDGCDADAVVIPEPTDFDLWIANDGVSYFRVTVEGRGAHAAHTDEGVNAIGKLYPIYRALEDLHDHRKETVHDDLFEREYEHTVSLNPGTLRAGEWPSSVPDEAVLEGRVSHAPAETREEIRATVEETVREAVADDPWFDEHPPEVEWFGWRGSSASISPDEPIVRTVQDVLSESLGVEATAKGFPGGIDTRFFVNYADTPALCFGPGAHNIHGTDESLPVEELERAIAGLALIAMAWCGYEMADDPTAAADATAEGTE
ncbi:ArgE/DapE family deacylase [Haloarcula salina]|uniref:Probable succinyl-diaminopimelate desuccinylase n=1 Tax=Haloarcula salina TaxID=1429914 RepID=A0AA41G3D0_9EURY|nr:ArgE/DapE family deacylase [Haloarcula salina]MBV0902806.1 ArgE/DapE family deacylase [Haloarcula salina]